MPSIKVYAILATIIFSGGYTFAQDVTVFDVRKPIALSKDQKVYKDYFFNAGSERGIKVGMVVTVNRSQAMYDAYQNKSPGSLAIPVGRLKIIHVQKGVSVARAVSSYSRKSLPVIDYSSVMVGDRVNMASLGWPKKRSTASTSGKKPSGSKDFASKTPKKEEDVILPNLQ